MIKVLLKQWDNEVVGFGGTLSARVVTPWSSITIV